MVVGQRRRSSIEVLRAVVAAICDCNAGVPAAVDLKIELLEAVWRVFDCVGDDDMVAAVDIAIKVRRAGDSFDNQAAEAILHEMAFLARSMLTHSSDLTDGIRRRLEHIVADSESFGPAEVSK